MNTFLPLFIDMKDKQVLIIGAGEVAYRKAKTLISYGARVKIITKKIRKKEILNLKSYTNFEIYDKVIFGEEFLKDKFLVITATDDKEFNDYVVELCRSKNILVNNASSRDKLDVRMCSIFENDEYQIGISAYGQPKKSQKLRDNIKNFLNLQGGNSMKRIINTENAPAALGPYSQGIEVNGTLYVSGQIPFVPATMTLVSDDVQAQTRQSLENVGAILKEAGYTFADVVKASVFIKDMNDFAAINEIYNEYLGEVKPARACVEVARLPKDVKVEIEVIAVK